MGLTAQLTTLFFRGYCRHYDQEVEGVVIMTTTIEKSGFNLHPGYVVAFFNTALYHDHLCLVALNKLHIDDGRSQTSNGKLEKWSTPQAGADSSKKKRPSCFLVMRG